MIECLIFFFKIHDDITDARWHDKYIFIMNDKTVDADELVFGVKKNNRI